MLCFLALDFGGADSKEVLFSVDKVRLWASNEHHPVAGREFRQKIELDT